MRRMHTKKEIEEAAGGFDPADIPEGILAEVLGVDSDGEAVKGNLDERYVIKIPAPASSTLSDETEAKFDGGVYVEGSFLGYTNPCFYPSYKDGSTKYGVIIGRVNGSGFFDIAVYKINASHVISITSKPLRFTANGLTLYLTGDDVYVKGKKLPANPSETGSFTFKFKNGVLTWLNGNGLYLHTVMFVVGSENITFRFITDSSDELELDQVSGNYVFPNATFMQPINHGNFIFTPFNANGFNPDVWSLNTSTGAFTNDITLDSIDEETVTPIG